MHRFQTLFNVKGKVAIVTGASKGIGESIARALAEYGAKVIVSSRKQDDVDSVAASYREDGLEAVGIACHVGEDEQLKNLVDRTVEMYGGVDIVINNAATNPTYGSLLDIDNDVFGKIMDVNVRSCHTLGNLVHPIMKERGGGSIVNISSISGLGPSQGIAMYSVSKAALIRLTENQAKEWGKDKIRVNSICPGLIKTKFSAALWQNEQVLKHVEKNIPTGRIAMPDEMAGLALFLASDASSYCTGAHFVADGGAVLNGY